jgi:hypothetical protein
MNAITNTIEQRKAWLEANRHRFTPERLLAVTEKINQDQAQKAMWRTQPSTQPTLGDGTS